MTFSALYKAPPRTAAVLVQCASLTLFCTGCFDKASLSVKNRSHDDPTSTSDTNDSQPGPPTPTNAPTAVGTANAAAAKNFLPAGIFEKGESWIFHIRDNGIPPWTGPTLKNSFKKYGLGGVGTVEGKDGRRVTDIAEFDYTYYNIRPGQQIGDGTYRDNRDCYGPEDGCYKSGPANPAEGYARLQSYWNNHLNKPTQNAWVKATTGHYYFQHYAAEFGADLIVSEVGEGINSINAHLAFTRGAGRQFGRSWGMDFSSWYGPTIRDYSQKKVWGSASGPNNGHSISLTKRMYYATYMAGAQYLLEEGGCIYFFDGETLGADGLLQLSPMGTMAQEFSAFVAAHPDRGQPYAHAAVLLEHNHGMGLGWWRDGKPWDYLKPTTGYSWTSALFNALWPQSFSVMPAEQFPEGNFMVRGPLGDTVDVLLENAGSELLKNYKILFLSGDLEVSRDLLNRLYEYLVAGGTLVIQYPQLSIFGELAGNTSQPSPIGSIPLDKAFRYAYSKGTVVYVRDGSSYADVVANLYWDKIPVLIQGNVQVLLNRMEHSWVATLINNNGVTKSPTAPETNDGGNVQVIVGLRGQPTEATVWRSAHKPQLSGGQFYIQVDSGDLAIVEFADPK